MRGTPLTTNSSASTPRPKLTSPPLSPSTSRRRDRYYLFTQLIGITDEKSIPVKNHLTGKVERHHMNNHTFNEQFYNYNTYGVFMDTSQGGNKFFQKIQNGPESTNFELEEVTDFHV
jgi:hypothetical protein